jgi:D-psicose/D-tagatose/L-ribulose 3-epimerase
MAMQIGIHTFIWNDGQSQPQIEEALRKTKEAGFVLMELPGLDPKVIKVDRVAQLAQQLDLKLAASCGLPPDCDVTSDDPATVKRGEALVHEQVLIARDVGATQLSGPIYSGHQKFLTLPTKKGWDTSVDVLRRVSETAKSAGVSICFEVLNRYETNLINTVEQGLAFIQDTGADNIFLHIDTYHMNIEEAGMTRAIKRAGNRIGYFHVGESHRGLLGTGHINFAPVFDALLEIGYSKNISVEAFNNHAMGDRLRAILASWRDVWRDPMNYALHSRNFIELQIEEARLRAAAYRRT